jgi:arabinose-5-phosphate isomerase
MLDRAKAFLSLEADAILGTAARLDHNFADAAACLAAARHKIVLTGIGKSGRIAEKLAATFSSTGLPAVFLHAAEAVHGDVGVLSPGDPVVLLSRSGATAELLHLLPTLRSFGCPLIALLGNRNSPLAQEADMVLDATVPPACDPFGVPAGSITAALALGHALALAVAEIRKFSHADFARFHPAGQIGRNLHLRVHQTMHRDYPAVSLGAPLRELIIEMTRRPLGAACVVDADGHLLGLITDGDLRRALAHHDDIRVLCAADIMTPNPVTASPDLLLHQALTLMEDRPSQISVLPVLHPETQTCQGLLRIHDIYSAR